MNMSISKILESMRNTLSKRPLCFACGLFLIVLFTTLYTEWPYALPAGLVALGLAVGALVRFFLYPERHRFLSAFLVGMMLSASVALLTGHFAIGYSYHQKIDPLDGESGQAVLVVTRPTSATTYSTTCEGKLVSLDGEEIGLDGIFTFPYEASLQTGERLTAEITIEPMRGEEDNDLGALYSLSQGLTFSATVSSEGHLKTGNEWLFPSSMSASIKDALSEILMLYLPDDACGLASALLVGDKSNLSSELSDSFRHLGLSHTLAISGLHLGILLGSLTWLLKKLHFPRRAHLWVLVPITLLYMLIVGSPSVMRAGGMLLLMLFAHPLGRKRDSLTSLFVSVSFICLISPYSVLDIGLLLSFFSTFGILLVGLPLTKHYRHLPAILRWLLDSLVFSASAITFTMPFYIWYFGELSLISPIANLLFIPLITLLLYLIPLLLLFSPIPLLAATPAYALRLLTRLTVFAAKLLGSDDTFMLSLELPLIRTVGLIWLLLGIGLLLFRKTRPIVLAWAAVYLIFSGTALCLHTLDTADEHELFAYSDGQNDALLLREGTRVMLCDASGGSYRFLSDAIAYAERDPAVRVDSLLLTHYHQAMLASLNHLLENYAVEYLILPLPDCDHADLATTLENRAKRVGCTVRYYSKEDCLVGYHGYTLLIDSDGEGTHPLNALTVSYDGKPALHYVADGDYSATDAPLLPAFHHADLPPNPSLWNRRYD